jgi:hypothetical protein
MARTSDTDALVATIMAKALKDTIHRLEAVLETHIETSSELSPVGESDPTDDDDPLRRLKAWFIANLACPYPSLSQRQRFASDLGVPVRNINGQFTNWRRRTGWSRIKKEWAGNTHEGMSTLLSRYTAGTESRPDVRAAIRRMTQYLEDDTAGQWINTILSRNVEHSSPSSSRSSSLSLASHQLDQLSTPPSASRSPSPQPSSTRAPCFGTGVGTRDRPFDSALPLFTARTPDPLGALDRPTRKRRRSELLDISTAPQKRLALNDHHARPCARVPTPSHHSTAQPRPHRLPKPPPVPSHPSAQERHEKRRSAHDGTASPSVAYPPQVATSGISPILRDWLAPGASLCATLIPEPQ